MKMDSFKTNVKFKGAPIKYCIDKRPISKKNNAVL